VALRGRSWIGIRYAYATASSRTKKIGDLPRALKLLG
jgi:hypothetical protein